MALGNPIRTSPSTENESLPSHAASAFASILMYALVLVLAALPTCPTGTLDSEFSSSGAKTGPGSNQRTGRRVPLRTPGPGLVPVPCPLAAGSAPTGTLCKCVPPAKLRRCHPLFSLPFCFFFNPTFHIFFLFPWSQLILACAKMLARCKTIV